MAITNSELEISNKSYTNKDFESIYNELMDMAKKLSTRFDPANSNESDPFVVLLKLAAFVGDKLNYNVDKNILERFMLSCTQEKSMSELTEMMGYNMHYYIAAQTDVIFKYTFSLDTTVSKIVIPKYSIIYNATNDVQYITKYEAEILPETGTSVSTTVIQGVLKTFTVLDSDSIQLENLDENNRLYFPEQYVAQNGVFIDGGNSSSEGWESVDNLNTQVYGSAVYKFGYDSRQGLPYIEFPDWIANIIGSGLSIKYVITDGANGNLKAKTLTTVSRNWSDTTQSDDISDSDIVVSNSLAATTGQDPETIDESYTGFKKIIGTFDTLVTCRDYANAIYNMLDNTNNNIVSNAQVADRRTDINHSCNVVSYTSKGLQTLAYPRDITAYDMCLYPFKPIKDTAYSSINLDNGYYDSFKYDRDDLETLENGLDDYKCISHDFKEIGDTDEKDILAVKNYYKLTAIITTTAKVNSLEQVAIIENINNALSANYNAHKVDFGYEIPFDSLLQTIQDADSRIKSVSLYEPEQTPKIYSSRKVDTEYEEAEEELYDSDGNPTNEFLAIVSKNILSGKVSLFEYDESFVYDYMEKDSQKLVAVKAFTSEANITLPANTDTYELRQNENIQFIAPSFVTKLCYPYGVNYYLELASTEKTIPANAEYTLLTGEQLVCEYIDSNDNDIIEVYTAGQVISPNFEMLTSQAKKDAGNTPTKKGVSNSKYPSEYSDPDKYFFYTLSTNDELNIRELNQETVASTKLCYWYLNKDVNEIPWDEDTLEYTLDDGEYFFYTDSSYSSLNSYGSGVKLKLAKAHMIDWDWTADKNISLSSITENGLSSISAFKAIAFTTTDNLVIQDQTIVTLVENDQLLVNTTPESNITISNNEFETNTALMDAGVKYKLSGSDDEISLADRSSLEEANQWRVRGLLDINISPLDAQTLIEKDIGKQSITFYLDDELESPNEITIEAPKSFKCSVSTTKGGGDTVSLKYLDINLNKVCPDILTYTAQTQSSNLSKIVSDLNSQDFYYIASFISSDTSFDFYTPANVYYNYTPLTEKPTNWSSKYNTYFVYDEVSAYYKHNTESDWDLITTTIYSRNNTTNYYDKYIMVYVDDLTTGDTITLTADTGTIKKIFGDESGTADYVISENGLYMLNVSGITTKITAKPNSAATAISKTFFVISALRIPTEINPLLGSNMGTLSELNSSPIVEYLETNYEEALENFYATSVLDASKQIELTEAYPLDSAQAFYDYNNIANKWTISELDFKNSDIKIAKSSTK